VRNVIKRGELLIGFREKGSHFVTDIARCETLLPAVGEHLLELRALLGGLECGDEVPQVEVSAGDDEIALLVRHLKPLSEPDRAALAGYGKAHGVRMYSQIGSLDTLVRLDEPDAPLHYTTQGIEVEFRPGDFVQVNAGVNAQMVPLALALLDLQADDRVLDLFSGLGNFTLPLAARVLEAVGIEGEEGLVRRARHNAERLGMVNARFEVGDLFTPEGIAAIPREPWTKLLLDPPRSGALQVLDAMRLKWIERVVYVSCNPVTLARDAAILTGKHGYTLSAAGVLDMFPHTAHVESIALFERR
jgi:23S rRNA (uracil1939-C5)-methyltransferase